MRTWRKQLHTPDHRPLLVIVEPILTRLEAGNDRMPCCRRMLGRMLARRTVTATDVSTLHAATEMKPPAFGRRQAFDTPIAARLRNGIDSALLFFDSQFPSVSWQPNSASSCAPSATSRSSELASSADLARDLPQVISEPIFDIPGLVEAALHQRFDSILCGRSPERRDARIPPSAELDIRRQAGVDEALGLGDRPFVELCDPRRKRLDECIEVGVGQRSIDVAVGLGLVSPDIFRAQ